LESDSYGKLPQKPCDSEALYHTMESRTVTVRFGSGWMPAQDRPEMVDGFAGYRRTRMAVSRRGGVFVIFDVARRISVTRYIAANILAGKCR